MIPPMRLAPLVLLTACGSPETLVPLRTCTVDVPDRAVLHADGTALRDAQDRAITLRGVNAGGRSKFAPFSPFDFADDGFDAALEAYLDRAASFGVDVLRVPFSWAAFEPVRGQDDAEWLARYDALLEGAWQRGLWTIVDFHQDVYAEPFCGDGFPVWTLTDPPPARTECANWFQGYFSDRQVGAAFDALWAEDSAVMADFEAMWRRMAAHQADRPGVIGFEVMNEPYQGTGDRVAWNAERMPAFYETMADVLQGEAPDALVVFEPSGIEGSAGATILGRPDRDNLVFAPHYYDPRLFTGGANVGADLHAVLEGWAEQGEAWDLPVVIGELGISPAHPQAAAYAATAYDAADAANVGLVWWEYSDAVELWNEEDFSVVGSDGQERESVLSALVRPYVRAVAGRVLSEQRGDVYEVRIDSTGGVTEIVLPERLFGTPELQATGSACGTVEQGVLYVRAREGRAFTVRATPE